MSLPNSMADYGIIDQRGFSALFYQTFMRIDCNSPEHGERSAKYMGGLTFAEEIFFAFLDACRMYNQTHKEKTIELKTARINTACVIAGNMLTDLLGKDVDWALVLHGFSNEQEKA